MQTPTAEKPSEESNWAGPGGERWLANLDRFESMIQPIGDALLELADFHDGEKVIDLGCGAGATSVEIARRVGVKGSVTGLDISEGLLKEATRRATADGLKQLRFILGDAAQAPLPKAAADCVLSRFGSMFFSDPYAAFAHIHGFLKPGGRIALACWAPLAQNPWMMEVRQAVSRHFAVPPMIPRTPGPFAFDNPDYLRDILSKAKFSNVTIIPWHGDIPVGGKGTDPDIAAGFLLKAVSMAQFIKDASESLKATVHKELTALLKPRNGADGVVMPASAWMVSGRGNS